MTNATANNRAKPVWRYMGLARYLWMLQFKQLWLSRADLLGDPWEIPLTSEHVAFLAARHPIGSRLSTPPRETFEERTNRVITAWRRATYVSCWCESEHESHALWRVYCGANEGIAIKTTIDKLRDSTSGLAVVPVRYELPTVVSRTPTLMELVTTKRPMFAYECEVRVVAKRDDEALSNLPDGSMGYALSWDPETHLHAIYVHPEADAAFMEVVKSTTTQNAASLCDRIFWSKMRDRPPF